MIKKRIFKYFYSLNWNLKSAFIMTHVEVVAKKTTLKAHCLNAAVQEFIN
jgi:hypothetical protein